jgi:hypothetical protein
MREKDMKTIHKLALATGALFFVSVAAQADDYTSTTRTVHHDGDHSGAYVGVPGVVGVHVGSDRSGCETRSKTETDQDTGESRTRTESNC